MKKIIYFHGYGSTGESGTVVYLRKHLNDCQIIAPDIEVDPAKALPQLRELCEWIQPDLIIGTSQGGMYAMQMHGFKRVCVNPALRMTLLPDILKKGTFEFFQPRIDGTTEYTVDDNIIEHYREMEQHMYDGLTPEDAANVYGLFGDSDTTVNFRDEWKEHFDNFATFEGEHRMNNRVIRDTVLPLVQTLLK